jgi:hypothetical protein
VRQRRRGPPHSRHMAAPWINTALSTRRVVVDSNQATSACIKACLGTIKLDADLIIMEIPTEETMRCLQDVVEITGVVQFVGYRGTRQIPTKLLGKLTTIGPSSTAGASEAFLGFDRSSRCDVALLLSTVTALLSSTASRVSQTCGWASSTARVSVTSLPSRS